MTETVEPAHRLPGIAARAWEHPADRAATAALDRIPMLQKVVHLLVERGYARAYRRTLLGGAVRLGERQLPPLWTGYQQVRTALDIEQATDVYLINEPMVNAMVVGGGEPFMIVHSGAHALFDEAETRTVLAHELGHVAADHVTYTFALSILQVLTQSIPMIGALPLRAVQMVLLEWSRAAELSCDRAAALATRDPLLVARTLMTLSAGVPSSHLDLDAFLAQTGDYQAPRDLLDRIGRQMAELQQTHGPTIVRCQELMRWVRSGDYDRILAGEYPRRDQPASDPGEEARAAAEHYATRFRGILGEAGEAISEAQEKVGQVGERVQDWLRRRGES